MNLGQTRCGSSHLFGGGSSAEGLSDDGIISFFDMVDLVDNKCGISSCAGDWQQRICSLRQVCQCVASNVEVLQAMYVGVRQDTFDS